jgi:molybdopterin-guanine dinucleotide biosynthesis protein B
VKVFGIVGRKDSGKTHLVVRLVRHLGGRGLAVATVKHTHHHGPQVDRPGSDSARHFEAGAVETVLASDTGWVLFHRSAAPPTLDAIAARIDPCDLLLVEGYKQLESLARLEVYLPAGAAPQAANEVPRPEPPLAFCDPGIAAIACPRDTPAAGWPARLARLDLDDTEAVAEFVLANARDADGRGAVAGSHRPGPAGFET